MRKEADGKAAGEEREMDGKKRRIALYTAAPALIFMITWEIFYKQTMLPKSSDIVAHMEHALSLDMVLEVTHCGWHFVCWLFYACLPISIQAAASMATALFNAASAVLVIWLLERYLKGRPAGAWLSGTAAVIALTAGPLYLRFYNSSYYLGQGSPNPWHNPTSTAVRPFMILITILTADYWALDKTAAVRMGKRAVKKTTLYQLALMVLLFLSTITKPSFLMVYLPACGLIALARLIAGKGKNFVSLLIQHLYFIPSLLVFLWQYLKIYILGGGVASQAGETGIAIDFFKVAGMYAPSVLFSLILKMAFPFLVILLWRKVIFKDRLFQLTFLQFIMGLLITWTFVETGKRASHGNFGWGNILASSMLWIFCVVFYVRELTQNREAIGKSVGLKIKFGVPGAVLLWHFLAGAAYYWQVLHNMSGQL